MIAFICLFFPAVVSCFFYEYLTKKDLSIKKWIMLYVSNVLFINLICFLLKHLVLGTGSIPMYTLEADMTPNTAFKYIIMSLACAYLIPVVQVFSSKRIKLEVEEDNEKE